MSLEEYKASAIGQAVTRRVAKGRESALYSQTLDELTVQRMALERRATGPLPAKADEPGISAYGFLRGKLAAVFAVASCPATEEGIVALEHGRGVRSAVNAELAIPLLLDGKHQGARAREFRRGWEDTMTRWLPRLDNVMTYPDDAMKAVVEVLSSAMRESLERECARLKQNGDAMFDSFETRSQEFVAHSGLRELREVSKARYNAVRDVSRTFTNVDELKPFVEMLTDPETGECASEGELLWAARNLGPKLGSEGLVRGLPDLV